MPGPHGAGTMGNAYPPVKSLPAQIGTRLMRKCDKTRPNGATNVARITLFFRRFSLGSGAIRSDLQLMIWSLSPLLIGELSGVMVAWGVAAMRSEALLYLRDLAHGLADLAEKRDLGMIARLYRMAEMETANYKKY